MIRHALLRRHRPGLNVWDEFFHIRHTASDHFGHCCGTCELSHKTERYSRGPATRVSQPQEGDFIGHSGCRPATECLSCRRVTSSATAAVAQPQECLSRRRVTSSATAAVAQPHSVCQRLHTTAFPVKEAVLRAVVGGIRARVGARLFK